MFVLVGISASGADRFSTQSEQVSIATTARIVKLDFKNQILKVRGSDSQSFRNPSQIRNISQLMQGLKQHISFTLPGGIAIGLPGRNPKTPPKQSAEPENADEYTVVITPDTLIQDGSDPVRLEDFKIGEIISIHGTLNGKTLTASRIAKWA
jgi:hypothetical protein